MAEIATGMLDAFAEGSVKELIDLHPWMKDKKFTLLTQPAEVDSYIDFLISKGLCALDLEATGLNLRVKKDGSLYTNIVGICLAHCADEGVYIPVAHEDKEYNLPIKFAVQALKRLTSNCVCVYHHFKYDGALLRNYGIILEDEDMYEDTYLMSAVEDASRRSKGLKGLSKGLLGRPMIEIDELGVSGSKKNVVAFNMVPPQVAVYYGGSDAMNTFALYEYFKKKIDEQDPEKKAGPWAIYKIEKRCQFATMEMERNLIKINKSYLIEQRDLINTKIGKIALEIYAIAGREFDINSPKQLGIVLFDELKVRYPIKEKSATGQYLTNEKVLSLLDREAPVVTKILTLRSLEKLRSTYIENLINNSDEDECIRFQLNQVQADTGRFSASGGSGLEHDGFCGVQCQNIPTYNKKDPDSVDIRKAIIARPGFKIVTIDYSGEELRVAANFSREPKWLYEFLHGSADLHTMTGKIIYGKEDLTKEERSKGKTLNFLTLYGGGPQGFAAQAKISVDEAKKMMYNFFKGYHVLDAWIKSEHKRARKRGYSKTAFGRRRPLQEYYDSPDFKKQMEGDRRAVNSVIQGTSADVLKIVLWRVWKWIKQNGFTSDDIRILMPIHDEIVYEIKEEKLGFFIEHLRELMIIKDLTDKLGWPVPFEVDAEYGDSLSVDHDYYKEKEKMEKEALEHSSKNKEEISKEVKVPEETKVVEAAPLNFVNATTAANVRVCEATGEQGAEFMNVQTITTNDSGKNSLSIQFVTVVEKAPEDKSSLSDSLDDIALTDESLSGRLDEKGFYIYQIADTDYIRSLHLKSIFSMLEAIDGMCVGPRCRIKILDPDGSVLFKNHRRVAVDAFLALCSCFHV